MSVVLSGGLKDVARMAVHPAHDERRPERTARILVVDDDPGIRSLLQELLDWEGYRVETAGDGAEGLARIRAAPPDLVLLDLMMPGLDGWEVYRRLRADGPRGVPVILITAGVLAARARQEFPDAPVVGKPFDLDHLLAVIQQHL
ncbi:MAG TPA: response regulator, partial [Dehalococcoidia bacterium]